MNKWNLSLATGLFALAFSTSAFADFSAEEGNVYAPDGVTAILRNSHCEFQKLDGNGNVKTKIYLNDKVVQKNGTVKVVDSHHVVSDTVFRLSFTGESNRTISYKIGIQSGSDSEESKYYLQKIQGNVKSLEGFSVEYSDTRDGSDAFNYDVRLVCH